MFLKKHLKIILIIVVSIITCVFIALCTKVLYRCFFDLNNLPAGTYISESISPNKQYIIKAYLCSGNGTTDNSVRCEVIDLKNKEKKNIYWQYKIDKADIYWRNNVIVCINGKQLNILKDSYDWRR